MVSGRRRNRKIIDQTLEDLRERYSALADAGLLSAGARRAFEDRYFNALKAGIDLQRFLAAEKTALEELETRASGAIEPSGVSDALPGAKPGTRGSENLSSPESDNDGPGDIPDEDPEAAEPESFLDRVTRELYERIDGYPSAVLPAGASYDMEKLAGMLMQFGRDYWPEVERAIRNGASFGGRSTVLDLESRVLEHCMPDSSGLPRFCDRYVQAVHGGREAVYEQEEKRCLAAAARFLHEIKKEVYALMPRVEEEERLEALKNAEGYILSALENFRMKDLRLL